MVGAMLLPGMMAAGLTATATGEDLRSEFADRLRLLGVSPLALIGGRLLVEGVRILPAALIAYLAAVVLGVGGFLDRLRLLPVSDAALVAGALAFEAARQLPIACVLLAIASLVGLPLPAVGGILIVLALSALWAAAWNAAFVVAAVRSRNPDIAQALLPMSSPSC